MSKAIHDPRVDRVYVADSYDEGVYVDHHEFVSMVHVADRGPDVSFKVFVRGQVAGFLTLPAADEPEMRRRLFVDPPASDGNYLRNLLFELEDAAAAHNVDLTIRARRSLAAYVDALRTVLAGVEFRVPKEATFGIGINDVPGQIVANFVPGQIVAVDGGPTAQADGGGA